MREERRDSSIFVLGILIAAALAFYGLWTEGNPIVVELVEQIKKHSIEYLPSEPITRIDKQVIYMTATPGPSVDSIIYGTPIPQLTTKARTDVVATLRELTPIVPTNVPMPPVPTNVPMPPVPTNTMILPLPRSTMPPMPPTEAPVQSAEVSLPPTLVPTVPPPPTLVPTVQPPPSTLVPTVQPPPSTLVPTVQPSLPTNTPVPPPPLPTNTPVPPTLVPLQLAAPQAGNPELAPTGGMATINGKVEAEEELSLILTNGDYYASLTTGDGSYSFENVPNGTYNFSVAGQTGCGQITISVPEGHATLTYNYRFYKMQCAPIP